MFFWIFLLQHLILVRPSLFLIRLGLALRRRLGATLPNPIRSLSNFLWKWFTPVRSDAYPPAISTPYDSTIRLISTTILLCSLYLSWNLQTTASPLRLLALDIPLNSRPLHRRPARAKPVLHHLVRALLALAYHLLTPPHTITRWVLSPLVQQLQHSPQLAKVNSPLQALAS
jgi:hypothetical protein